MANPGQESDQSAAPGALPGAADLDGILSEYVRKHQVAQGAQGPPGTSGLDGVMTRLFESWGLEKIKALNVLNHRAAEGSWLNPQHIANQYGVSPEVARSVMPYPPTIQVIHPDTAKPQQTDASTPSPEPRPAPAPAPAPKPKPKPKPEPPSNNREAGGWRDLLIKYGLPLLIGTGLGGGAMTGISWLTSPDPPPAAGVDLQVR